MLSKQPHDRSNGNTPAKYDSDGAGAGSAENRAASPRSPTKNRRRSKAAMREAVEAVGLTFQEGKQGLDISSPPALLSDRLCTTTTQTLTRVVMAQMARASGHNGYTP